MAHTSITLAEFYADIYMMPCGLRYINPFKPVPPYVRPNKNIASFKNKEEAQWAIHMVRLFLFTSHPAH